MVDLYLVTNLFLTKAITIAKMCIQVVIKGAYTDYLVKQFIAVIKQKKNFKVTITVTELATVN